MRTAFDYLQPRGSMFAVFARQMMIAGYHNVVPGESVLLRWAQEQALFELKQLDTSMAEQTIGSYTSQLKKLGVIETYRAGRSYKMTLTDLGARTLEELVKDNPEWGTTLEPAREKIELTEDQREALLNKLLKRGFHAVDFVEPKDRTLYTRQVWRVLFDAYVAGELKILFVEKDLKMVPNE